MFTFKSIIIRSIEVYESEQDSARGMTLFFNAYFQSSIYIELRHKKPVNKEEIRIANRILKAFIQEKDEKKKNRLLIMMKNIVNSKYKIIHKFLELDEIKNSEYVPDFDLNIDRKHIFGCVGTVMES